jgi:acetyl-CoA acetyltransferase family protein
MARTSAILGPPLILAGQRTPMGRHWGSLSEIRPDDLAAFAIRAAVNDSGLQDDAIEEVHAGIVNASGEAMGNVARFSALLAGLSTSTSGLTMNRYCGSGLSAFISLAHAVGFGSTQAGVAVGVEVMSRSTWPVAIPVNQRYPGILAGRNAMWSGAGGPQHPELEANGTMIEMPEAVQAMARQNGIGRGEMDEFALRSQQRAASAWDEGRFADEVFSVATGVGEMICDETYRRESTLEGLGRLRSYFPGCPDITAGNSSSVADGASALVVADGATARHFDLKPLGEVVATAVAGVAPADFALGPVPAIRKLLSTAALSLDDIGLIEINEAFAVQTLACIRELGIDESRLNVNGGAIALGHALGNSGTRILVTLVHEMRRRSTRFGIASLCVGGGMGVAVLVRNPSA